MPTATITPATDGIQLRLTESEAAIVDIDAGQAPRLRMTAPTPDEAVVALAALQHADQQKDITARIATTVILARRDAPSGGGEATTALGLSVPDIHTDEIRVEFSVGPAEVHTLEPLLRSVELLGSRPVLTAVLKAWRNRLSAELLAGLGVEYADTPR
jgi:hypothetical protein